MGFIADPAHRGNKHNQPSSKVTKIIDPVHTKTGIPTFTGGGKVTVTTTLQTNLIAITPNPTRVAPIIRDHTIPKTVVTTPPRSHGDAITSEGLGLNVSGVADFLGLDGSGFGMGFKAPYHRPQTVDHRTKTNPPRTGGK